jgi:MFS transporter, Spinster family, sphingosine-1-phosphate transporter
MDIGPQIVAAMTDRQRRFRNLVALGLLTAIYTVGYIDRQVLNLLVQPIKLSFGLTDVQVSLLQGLGFSSGYLLFSPLFGRWVDVGNRRDVIAYATGTWSLCTGLAGIVRSYCGLLAARFGLGGAEAAIAPACWSMIADLFEERQLPFAFGVFFLAPYVGGGLALLLGGSIVSAAATWNLRSIPWLANAAPWQLVFMVVSVPGLLSAALLLLIREPPRRRRQLDSARPPSLGQTFAHLWQDRGFFGNFYLGMACTIVPLYAFSAWMPGFLMRRFATPIQQVGSQWGLITLIAGCAGMLSGPLLATAMRRSGIGSAEIRLPVVCALGIAACCLVLHFCTTSSQALLLAGLVIYFNSAPLALAAAALQQVSGANLRGTTAALYSVIVMISGLAVAPTLVALLTDRVFQDETRVGDSLQWVCGVAGATGAFLLKRSLLPYARLRASATVPR